MKIKLKLLNNFKNLTGDEIDILIYIAQFQNDLGQIESIHYKKVCKTIGIHRTNFFKLIHSLDRKGFIKIDYSNTHPNHWQMQILDNVFKDDEDYKQGYLNVNFKILHTKAFYKLTKAEKLAVLHLLTRYRDDQHYFSVTLDKLIEVTDCKKESVKRFIKHLIDMEEFFDITYTPNGIRVSCFSEAFEKRKEIEKDIYNGHMLRALLNRKKTEAAAEDFAEMLVMFKQYAQVMSFSKIMEKVVCCIKNRAELIPKYINHLINTELWGT
jgi:DNA-binding MarR family transcriptional regulator